MNKQYPYPRTALTWFGVVLGRSVVEVAVHPKGQDTEHEKQDTGREWSAAKHPGPHCGNCKKITILANFNTTYYTDLLYGSHYNK